MAPFESRNTIEALQQSNPFTPEHKSTIERNFTYMYYSRVHHTFAPAKWVDLPLYSLLGFWGLPIPGHISRPSPWKE